MNEIKILGKVIKKDVFDNELFTRFILEIPTKMKVINDNKIERVNNYISFILFTPCINDFPEINKNTYTELLRALHSRNSKNIRNPLIFLQKMASYSCFWRVPSSKILLQASLHRIYDLLTLVSYDDVGGKSPLVP